MTIGIDITALQGAHRMRGIGFTVLNFISNISGEDRKKHSFVFFVFEGSNETDTLEIINVDGMDYEIRYVRANEESIKSDFIFSARMQRLLRSSIRHTRNLLEHYTGSSAFKDLHGIDVFIQPDQSRSFPRKRGMKKALILYDIIPYVLEWEYLWSYKTARLHNFSRKAALRVKVRRWIYLKKLLINVKQSDYLIAISQATKKDYMRYLGITGKKIDVVHLGVSPPSQKRDIPYINRYVKTSWGYLPKKYEFDNTPFLLYVGGADRRRRLDELVTAFNHLRGEGVNIKLVLTGDTMQGPNNIPTKEIQESLQESSYIEDVIFLGFTSDAVRNWLYRNALAFVYPSKYEGFGLPVLEAMTYESLVICYRNAAVEEVAGDAPLYVSNSEEIRAAVHKILSTKPDLIKKLQHKGLKQAQLFSWSKTSSNILETITNGHGNV